MAASVLPTRFEGMAPEILERIALYVVALTPLGPPSDLCNICLVSRSLNNVLRFESNSHLYASIFYLKFDHSAVVRRFSQRWSTTHCLASELKKRFVVLKRIRNRSPYGLEDLWTAYLMMSENDGRNERQLIEWASIEGFLHQVLVSRVTPRPAGVPTLWYTEMEGTSLITWLLWMTSSRDGIRREGRSLQTVITNMLHPFIVAGYRHPAIFAPDSRFHLPLCPHSDPPSGHPPKPAPRNTKIKHYGRDLQLAIPPITAAATLGMILRDEAFQDLRGLPDSMQDLPRNREEAGVGHRGATLEDVIEFHYHNRIHVPEKRPVHSDREPLPSEDDEDEPLDSKRHDEDWYRLVACYDPWMDESSLRGSVYSPGALCGSWAGRILQPAFDGYLDLLTGSSRTPHQVPIYHQPLYMRLREHHCLHPCDPLPIPVDETNSDDILNAWLPRGLDLRHLEDAIEVYDQTSERYIRYETFSPNGQAHYSKAVSEQLVQACIPDNESDSISDGGTGSNTDALADFLEQSYIDNDQEYEDTVALQSSGIADILITGETGERHGLAWGHYSIVGRVRPWDGLVVLLRTPVDSTQAVSGQWIFKGYIHDKNLVGRWRETSTRVDLIGYEGAFVMAKVDDS